MLSLSISLIGFILLITLSVFFFFFFFFFWKRVQSRLTRFSGIVPGSRSLPLALVPIDYYGLILCIAGPTIQVVSNVHIAVAVVISALIIACTALVIFYGRYEVVISLFI